MTTAADGRSIQASNTRVRALVPVCGGGGERSADKTYDNYYKGSM